MTDDRLKNFIGAAIDLAERARDYVEEGEPAHAALVIALKNFSVAHQSLAARTGKAEHTGRRSGKRQWKP